MRIAGLGGAREVGAHVRQLVELQDLDLFRSVDAHDQRARGSAAATSHGEVRVPVERVDREVVHADLALDRAEGAGQGLVESLDLERRGRLADSRVAGLQRWLNVRGFL